MAGKKQKQQLMDKALSHLKVALQDNVTLLDDYRQNLDAYFSKPYGNEIKGRSQVVMSDVSDTVEWIMPALMKIFYGGTKVVEIKPQGPEDEDKARLMEEKINFDFQKGMNGYTLLHDWFKTALLGKTAVVKYWWEKHDEYKKRTYEGLSAQEFAALQENPNFIIDETEEIVVQEALIDILGSVIQPEIIIYNVTGRDVIKISKPLAQAIPPEEFVFDLRTSDSLSSTEFCAHRKKVHKNYLRKYGVKTRDIESELEAFDQGDFLKDSRFEDLGGLSFLTDKKNSDFVYIYECYLNDYDKDGEPIPMKVTIFGSQVLEAEENTYGKPPFCSITSIRIPHRMAGRSLAELVSDIQKLKTALMRAVLDNIYYQNNAITIVNPYRINMDDVIDRNEPGAKWRTTYDIDPNTAIAPLMPNPLGAHVFSMFEMVESLKEKKTGVTSYNQGLDSKSLNKTATGISQIMGAAQQRMELIARMFAETGVRELFQAYVDMNLQFFDAEVAVKLNESWSQVTPEMIDGKYDILIDVGVGTGSNEVKIGQLMNMLNVSAPALQAGIVTPENYGNILKAIYELMGWKNTDKFVGGQQQVDPQIQQMQQQMQMMQQEMVRLKEGNDIKHRQLDIQAEKNETDADLKEREMALKYAIETKKVQIDARREDNQEKRSQAVARKSTND